MAEARIGRRQRPDEYAHQRAVAYRAEAQHRTVRLDPFRHCDHHR
ncbi:hypothetical protein [Micromonospora tulbaghiae]